MDAVSAVATAFWAMLPAYLPNNAAVLAGGGPPVDGGRTLAGNRLLGEGKTWRGTIVGALAGTLLAVVLDSLTTPVGIALGIDLPGFPLAVALSLSIGAMVGDLGASFLKRRMGRSRGAAVPGLDQLDFVIGALVLTAAVAPAWFTRTFSAPVLLVVLLLTPILHVGTNTIAYLLNFKSEPW